MRSTFATFCLTSVLLLGATAARAADLSPDALLQRGIDSYRAAKYQDAATDLNAAAQAILSPEQMQKYVDTGKFENLGHLETALVYLALAESKLGHDSAAHDAVVRLMTAERIEPVYAQLPLQADALDFEALAKRVAPGTALPANTYLAQGGAPAAIQVAQTTPLPATATTASAPATVPPPAVATAALPPVTETAAAPPQTGLPAPLPPSQQVAQSAPGAPSSVERDREEYIERRIAEERARLEKMFEERLAAERAAAQKEASEQIAAAQKNAQQQIEAAQKDAQQQIAAMKREAEQQAAATKERRDYRATVREGDGAAIQGKLDSARRLYATVANAPDASRDILTEAALGLYRTGGYRDAVNAFRRIAPFAHGEEDLRFYNAVSLYEIGDYSGAKKELACSLPYIERSEEVTRYQTKIEMTGTE